MDRREFVRCVGAAAAVVATPASGGEAAVRDLGEELEAVRKEYGLPGIGAAAVRGERVVAGGVAGVRRVGGGDKIALDDRFALASCTKRMTAAMIARVIDSGKVSFETTLAEALAGMPMREDYAQVTVAQLLAHKGGIQTYLMLSPRATPILFELKGSAAEQREQFIKHLLQEEPVVKPGTERNYSNASYALVAFVAERRTGRPWETLMEEEVFRPLGMNTAGFGRPRSKERPNEPVLHRKVETGYQPEPDGAQGPGQGVLAAAGNVHCSIRDFAKFAAYELMAMQGKDALLKPETAKRWQALSSGEVGGEVRAFFGGSPVISSGCEISPSKNLAVVVAVNGGGAGEAVKGVLKAVNERVGGL